MNPLIKNTGSAKILLVSPNLSYSATKEKEGSIYNRIWPPLSLANCAALLEREDFDVKIIDANSEALSPQEVAKRVGGFDKIFIASSTLDRWQCPHLNLDPFLNTVKEIRENSTAEIYVIGTHGTVKPQKILELSGANAVIRKEPESIVLEICRNSNLSEIDGITYKQSGRVISNPDAEPPNLADFPVPAFHLLPMEKYFYEVLGNNFTLFEGSRGCPFQCIFCLQKMFHGYRKKPVENLIRDVEYAVENLGVKTAYFMDLEFTLNRDLVEKLCDFLIEKRYDFKWCCQTRADSVDEEMLRKMKDAGCSLIHYGVETGSPRVLETTNKNITLDKIEKGIKLTHDIGIETVCFFMFGLPTETREDMQKTIEFAKKLNPTYASFHVADPYPGTRFYEMVKDELDEEFPVAYTGKYPFEELRGMTKKAFFSFYLRPSYILSRLSKGNIESLIKQFRLFLGYLTRERI